MIPLFSPFIPKKEILKELKETLSGRWIGQAHKVDEFEKKFAKKYGYKYCLFTNSCTSALNLAYHLIGINEDDEVIVPVLDCTAGQMDLLHRKAKIVFVDISSNLTIDVDDVKRNVSPQTKAIVAVNLGGIKVSDELYKFAKKRKIPVITDAAQDLSHCQGDYICHSFQAIKHITTADGGMLVLNNKKEYDRAKKLRWFGIDRELKAKNKWQAWEKRQMTFDIEEAGFKYQPTDIDACFGLVGLKFADKAIRYRNQLVNIYKRNLRGLQTISGGTNWIFGIIHPDRDKIAAHLKNNGIETNLVHLRNDIFKVFGGQRLRLPNMDSIESQYLYLPLHNNLTPKDIKFICNKVNESLS
jgi:perosamine synthetase